MVLPASILIVQTGDLRIYDGPKERCKLDEAKVNFKYGNNAEDVTLTTKADTGQLDDSGTIVLAKYTTVLITVTKTGYKTVSTRVKIVWAADSGALGLDAVYMEKNS